MKRISLLVVAISVLLSTTATYGGNVVSTQRSDTTQIVPFTFTIEKTHQSYLGCHEYVDVDVIQGTEPLLWFDLLLAYDTCGLSFQSAMPGSIYDDCGWEYFTFRHVDPVDCSGYCPSGLLRVVGIAETDNGANHPICFAAEGKTLFTLDFLITSDRDYECVYLPIRFFWTDCSDNSISFHDTGDSLNPNYQTTGVSRSVYDFEGAGDMANGPAVFPTYLGAPDVCLETAEVDQDSPVRFVDFYNGGIDLVCLYSIDMRGDINHNGRLHEMSDAVLLADYFVYGVGVFTFYQTQLAASDVNADGIPLSIADLVYLFRLAVGDPPHHSAIAPVATTVDFTGSEISVSDKMGAAYVVVNGQANPTLLVDNMEMMYAFDASENVTRVLVYSTEANRTFQGAFLDAGGSVNRIELATYEGVPVEWVAAPQRFSLSQNYPNPFNPITTIEFELPTAGDYTLTVFNVTGQQVMSVSGRAYAGVVTEKIDLSAQASGVYFYNVTTANDSQTRKMVLMK